ncbi:MAG: GapR family DNA-binding domain-containing protein [Pacificimonas sp.]
MRLFIERIERLEEEKKAIAEDIKQVYGESKSEGFDVKTMRTIVRLRAMDTNARQEQEALLDTYKAALGMSVGDDED